MSKFKPSVVWLLWRNPRPNKPLIQGLIRTTSSRTIGIDLDVDDATGHHHWQIDLERSDARLLARRINECLEATK